MSADERFLARWSRRKRGAAQAARAEAGPEATAGAAVEQPAAPSPPLEEVRPLVDPATLPAIESIGPVSDVSGFLAAGVPLELTRAALRRAWSADPAIRDFIGLAENSWDFNSPGGVPGFGPLPLEDAARLLARLTGEENVADSSQASTTSSPEDRRPPAMDENAADKPAEAQVQIAPPEAIDVAAQHERREHQSFSSLRKRRSGSALPREPSSLE